MTYPILETEIRFNSGETGIAGTLALPGLGGPFPAVILIPGSGPLDRNENHKKIALNVFNDISQYLAQNGIASLRYDKRGVGQSQGDFWASGFNDNAADALAALKFMKEQGTAIKPESIFFLGHSEGAFISVKLAAEGAETAGIILLAGGAQSGEAVLKWQAVKVAKELKGLNGWIIRTFRIDVSKAQEKQLNRIKSSKEDWYKVRFAKINAKWFREFMAYDPSADLPKITVPVLAITGSKDIQVDSADIEVMARLLKPPFEGRLIEGMTHMLRREEGKTGISGYREQIKKPVDAEVLETVLSWLKKRV